jgi:hypothetical protein
VNGLVLVVPADPIVLVPRLAEHLDDLAAARHAATDLVDRDPVSGARPGSNVDGTL